MKVLLDTCSFLWITLNAPELSETAKQVFQDPDNQVFLSSVSAWEITVKNSLGRLPLPAPVSQFVRSQREAHGIETLSLAEEAAAHVAKLPNVHRDPFDRMLVSQAIIEGLVILTPDPAIAQYPVRVLW